MCPNSSNKGTGGGSPRGPQDGGGSGGGSDSDPPPTGGKSPSLAPEKGENIVFVARFFYEEALEEPPPREEGTVTYRWPLERWSVTVAEEKRVASRPSSPATSLRILLVSPPAVAARRCPQASDPKGLVTPVLGPRVTPGCEVLALF